MASGCKQGRLCWTICAVTGWLCPTTLTHHALCQLPLLSSTTLHLCTLIAGCNILCIYRFGSQRMGLESPHYALPALRWLGARSTQLRQADADSFQVGQACAF